MQGIPDISFDHCNRQCTSLTGVYLIVWEKVRWISMHFDLARWYTISGVGDLDLEIVCYG